MPELEMPQRLDPEPKEIAVAYSITLNITQGRTLVVQTYLARDVPTREHNALLDKLGAVVDRQEAKYGMEVLKANLEAQQSTLKNLEDDFSGIETRAQEAWEATGRKGAFKLNANQQSQKQIAETNIKRYRAEIEKTKADLAQCEAKIAGG